MNFAQLSPKQALRCAPDQLRVDLRVSAAGPLNGIGGAWRTLTIDRDYILANQPPLKLKANLIYYRSVFIYETESGGNATSSIAYAFFFGVCPYAFVEHVTDRFGRHSTEEWIPGP